MRITRRESLGLAIGLGVGACAPGTVLEANTSEADESLNALARRSGRRFGSSVAAGRPGTLTGSLADPNYRALLTGQCGLIVPENELKWGWIRRTRQSFDFAPADRLFAFAEENQLAIRGHTLVWHHPNWFPAWVAEYDFGSNPRAEAERMIAEHVGNVCRRYGTRIHSYDVVNEAVHNQTGAMRETAFSRAMGGAERVLDLAFHTARETAPQAQLVYNDYMSWEPWSAAHRDGVLRLLEGFKRRGIQVDALGVQAHIGTANIDSGSGFGERQEQEWRRFLDAVVGMGYDLIITELDVHDKGLPAGIAERDGAVADLARVYLDLMLSYRQLGDIMVWGMSDRYSWLRGRSPRSDGIAKRPCPYDEDFRPKPLREAIAAALRNATVRNHRA